MFSLFSRNTMSDAPDVTPAPAKTSEPHPLDALTGGAFSAQTSGERSARIREWLATQPALDALQEVFKELSARDKGAARAVRERMDEIRRARDQEAIAVEWAEKATRLLEGARLNIADALAWQRDAAKAGAPLSREPLSALKTQLSERVKVIEDLQHRVQVQREAAVLLTQRIEVLSTKPWRDAQAALETLRADVQRWQDQAGELSADAAWPSVEARFPPQLDAARTQLLVVWDAFQLALQQAVAAAEDASASLPPVPVWADELRVARGEVPVAASAAEPKPARAARPAANDGPVRELARQAVEPAVVALETQTAQGHAKPMADAAGNLRGLLRKHGRWIDQALEARVHAALVAAGELQGWQRWGADQVREELIAKAQALLQRPAGQALGGRKIQESLRQLREQWKQADQGGLPNHALWKKFDEACNAAHKVVEAWLERVRTEAAEHKAQRLALIEEVKAWAAEHRAATDWKEMQRALRQFAERWRDSGHVGDKLFAELQPLWKDAMVAASAPLEAAQAASLQRREAMIQEAEQLGAAATLRIDAIKALQQRWQAEAQAVPLDRKHEQRLWDAFRKPLDDAFQRKSSQRDRTAEPLNARDRAVLEASKEVQAAAASGDAQRIRASLQALEAAMQAPAEPAEAAASAAAQQAPAAEADTAVAPAVPVAAPRTVVAVRGDDRPGARKDLAAAPARGADRRDARGAGRDGRGDPRRDEGRRFGSGVRDGARPESRGPRLGDTAFRAQRDAVEHAQMALRKLAAQAHGEVLTQLLGAWEQRNASLVPSAQDLGSRVSPAVRAAWVQALGHAAQGDGRALMLRLEIAADVPSPADQLSERRLLQLQLLTRRNDPAPDQTWGHDVASLLKTGHEAALARRLQSVLKALLRKAL
ncbi:hypothetical protein GCM10023090_07700 [Acidovorax lacteus]|uniref:DUF349 domain-containing protein n=2 Tax=Acidovorax lacteus TaxID=1924988 RepID=A0ABP8L1I7_9BURK